MAAEPLAYHEVTIQIPSEYRQALIIHLVSLGALGAIEQDASVIVYFPAEQDVCTILQEVGIATAIVHAVDPKLIIRVKSRHIVSEDWNAAWKEHLRPFDIGSRFTIIPTWEKPRKDRISLIIDPGMAFGTGHHETTRSCLVLMERHFSPGMPGSFLDIGTGTGLLAIAALKLGFRPVLAIDHDTAVIETAQRNLALNNAQDIELRTGDILLTRDQFTMISANLISETLVAFAPEIAVRLAPRGTAIFSGMLQGQEREVATAAAQAGLRVVDQMKDGKWISMVVRQH